MGIAAGGNDGVRRMSRQRASASGAGVDRVRVRPQPAEVPVNGAEPARYCWCCSSRGLAAMWLVLKVESVVP